MNRRSFFGALAVAPVVVAGVTPAQAKPIPGFGAGTLAKLHGSERVLANVVIDASQCRGLSVQSDGFTVDVEVEIRRRFDEPAPARIGNAITLTGVDHMQVLPPVLLVRTVEVEAHTGGLTLYRLHATGGRPT